MYSVKVPNFISKVKLLFPAARKGTFYILWFKKHSKKNIKLIG